MCAYLYSLSNNIPFDKYNVRVSHDKVVTGARDQVLSIALYKCLNINLF